MRRSVCLMIGLALVCCLATVVSPAMATTWDASAGYPTSYTNPNGVWSYGYKTAFNGTFSPYAFEEYTGDGLYQFHSPPSGYDITKGWIAKNPASTPLLAGNYYAANGIDMHPGSAGEATTIRWTSPINGTVDVSATWAIYSGWGAPAGWIAWNDTPWFVVSMLGNGVPGSESDPGVTGWPYAGSYNAALPVNVGTTIDIMVDWGPDNNWGGDCTGITFSISQVPEPSSLAALGVGAMSLLGLVWRRKRSS